MYIDVSHFRYCMINILIATTQHMTLILEIIINVIIIIIVV